MLNPCYGCKERRVGCHNVETCKPWAEWVEDRKKLLAWREEQCMNNRDKENHFKRMNTRRRPRNGSYVD